MWLRDNEEVQRGLKVRCQISFFVLIITTHLAV